MEPNSNITPEDEAEAQVRGEVMAAAYEAGHISTYIGGLDKKLVFVNKTAIQAAVVAHQTGKLPTADDDIHGWTVQVLRDPDDPSTWEYWRCYYWEGMGSSMGPAIAIRPNPWGRLMWVEFECPIWVYYTPGRGGLVGRDCEAVE